MNRQTAFRREVIYLLRKSPTIVEIRRHIRAAYFIVKDNLFISIYLAALVLFKGTPVSRKFRKS